MTTDTLCDKSKIAHPNKLREYRMRAGMTQAQLAARVNVSQPNLCKAERWGMGISNETWFRLSDLFNVDPRILRGWKPPEDDTRSPSL